MLLRIFSRLARFCAVVLLLLSHSAHGQTASWTGNAAPDPDWLNPANWLNNTPPSTGDTVYFDGNSAGDSLPSTAVSPPRSMASSSAASQATSAPTRSPSAATPSSSPVVASTCPARPNP